MIHTWGRLLMLVAVFFISFSVSAQKADKFTVVLDPGHGGKDSGTNHGKNVEKDIVLAVGLQVGQILEKNPDIKVVYTRKTDVFVEVKQRSVIANEAQGNVFVSIHCNGAANKDAYGTETFVMGLSKNKSNLDVAKTENSVIMLEDDYQTKYAGFDPRSPESIIGLTLLQEDYIHQSIDLAGRVQDDFTDKLKRRNRGVKQGPFWVLHGAFMPSVLIELGFVSNTSEGSYLNSSKGQKELAESIAKGILAYKKAWYAGGNAGASIGSGSNTTANTNAKAASTSSGVVYKIQIAASTRDLPLKPQNFRGLNELSVVKSSKINKYFYGNTTDFSKAQELLKTAKAKGHSSSFIVAFKGGEVITVTQAIK